MTLCLFSEPFSSLSHLQSWAPLQPGEWFQGDTLHFTSFHYNPNPIGSPLYSVACGWSYYVFQGTLLLCIRYPLASLSSGDWFNILTVSLVFCCKDIRAAAQFYSLT